jgi:hypothetical protein
MTWTHGAAYSGQWIQGKRHGSGNYALTPADFGAEEASTDGFIVPRPELPHIPARIGSKLIRFKLTQQFHEGRKTQYSSSVKAYTLLAFGI